MISYYIRSLYWYTYHNFEVNSIFKGQYFSFLDGLAQETTNRSLFYSLYHMFINYANKFKLENKMIVFLRFDTSESRLNICLQVASYRNFKIIFGKKVRSRVLFGFYILLTNAFYGLK